MIEMTARGVLLDIEGTTSSISFVVDVMFPFVRRELATFLDAHWNAPEVEAARRQLAHESADGAASADDRQWVVAEVARLMDADAKTTGLKQLQGLVWKQGFESGELQSHLFDDVPPALRAWHAAGIELRIYSSGSVAAQKLFFGHTTAGDLRPLLSGHFDTTTGPKRAAESYRAIAADWHLPAGAIVFVSDIPDELDAARQVGMQTVLSVRPGNAGLEQAVDHPLAGSFADLSIAAG